MEKEMKNNVNFQMASSDNPEEIIHATQISVLEGLQDVINKLKEDLKSQSGLSWEGIEVIIEAYKKKKPTIIFQNTEQ